MLILFGGITSCFTQTRYPFHGIVHVLTIHIILKSCQLVISLSTISRVCKMPAFMSKVHAGGIYRYLPAFTGVYRYLPAFTDIAGIYW